MTRIDTRAYVTQYLEAMNCHVIESGPGHVLSQLSEQADRDLVNRPFYWSYVEKLGIEPQPVTLSFIFEPDQTPDGIHGEHINAGSPRLQQIFRSVQKNGRYVRLYEDTPLNLRSPRGSRPYTPWLCVNYKIEWVCDRLRNEIHSLGIQLMDGSIRSDFYATLTKRTWTPRLPSHRFLTAPKLTPEEAVHQLEFYIQGYLEQIDDTWAVEAEERMQEELDRLAQYYEETPSGTIEQEYERRKRETKWQYQPRIEVSVINAGLFYMT